MNKQKQTKRTLIIILFAAIGILGCHQTDKKSSNQVMNANTLRETMLSGELVNSNDKAVILSTEFYADTFFANNQNQFNFTLLINKANYYILRNGGKNIRLFLNPGDSLYIAFDVSEGYKNLLFNGVGSTTNEYLQQKHQLLLEHSFSGSHLNEISVKEFRYLADSLYIIEKMFLDEFVAQNPNLSEQFIAFERASLLYDWATKLMEYPRLNQVNAILDQDKYFKFLSKVSLTGAQYLSVYEYRTFLNAYIAHYTNEQMKSSNKQNLDTYEVSLMRMQQVNRRINNQQIKDYLLTDIIKEQIRFFGYKNAEVLFQIYELNCLNDTLKQEVLNPYRNYQTLQLKPKAPEVKFFDAQGNVFSLSSFKGQYVYIDVWATWCLPCKKEAPYFEELRRKYADKNIAFIGLSVDEKKDDWIEYLNVRPSSAKQFLVIEAKPFLENYAIKTIPHFIIIGPDGKLVNPNAFRPSDADLNWFEKLPTKVSV